MEKKNLVFGRLNYLICIVAVIIIIIGFFLMSGPGSTEKGFNPDIFSFRRITVAPMFCLFGFAIMFIAIMLPKKGLDKDLSKEEINGEK